MNSTHLIATGFAAIACAAALVLQLLRSDDQDNTPVAEAEARQNMVPRARRPPETDRTSPSTPNPTRSSEALAGRATAPLVTHRVSGRKPPPGSPLSTQDWLAKVERVEHEANRELARLAPLLHLSADQQQQAFAIFARSSPAWQPGMGTAFEPAPTDGNPTTIDQLLSYLDADQQEALLREEMDRLAWWEEVLPQLLPPDSPAPETKTFDGPDFIEE
jgi:hypothetical protein